MDLVDQIVQKKGVLMALPINNKNSFLAAQLAAAKQKAQETERLQLAADNSKAEALAGSEAEASNMIKYVAPSEVKDRIKILFDDSGSMSYGKIDDAIQGCEEFLRNCGFNTTAVAIIPLNSNLFEMKALTTNLPLLAAKVKMLKPEGGTPLYQKWVESLAPNVTRFVIFSDGLPNPDDNGKRVAILFCKEHKISCDTVLIWDNNYANPSDSREYRELKYIADETDGIFMVFDRKKVNFKTAFKYLAPSQRLMLSADVGMQKDLQDGKLK